METSITLLTTSTIQRCISHRQIMRIPGPRTSLERTETASVRGSCNLVTWIGMSKSQARPSKVEDVEFLREPLADGARHGLTGRDDFLGLACCCKLNKIHLEQSIIIAEHLFSTTHAYCRNSRQWDPLMQQGLNASKSKASVYASRRQVLTIKGSSVTHVRLRTPDEEAKGPSTWQLTRLKEV